MLRPERMSRVSVTGSKRVMDDVIETVHDLGLLHVTEYDGSWDYFEPGDPAEGAENASEKLVTVRSLKSILDVDEADAGPTRLVTDEALDEELEEIRQTVNELDDRRDELTDELRTIEDEIQTIDPFVTLGIDLDLLQGYENLSVVVGEGDIETVRDALAHSDVDLYQFFQEDDVIAVAARTDEDTLQDALVSATFTELTVPDSEADPESYREELQHRKQQLESKLTTVEDELEDLRLDVAGFLLAAEEKLAIDVQKSEAPLTFATTEHAFVAEGWIPSDRYADLAEALTDAVGEAIEVDELERADYSDEGHPESTETVETDDSGGSGGASTGETVEASASDETESQEVAADGGLVTMGDSRPPVIQDNPGVVKPFEALVEIINRPQYDELDPTVVFFLTFPAFFGFMIGDLGYGVLYMGLGYWLLKSFDNDVVKSLGGVGLLSGLFTAIFGVLYGELFGLHQLGDILWNGHPPIHKGLQPHYLAYGQAWLLVSVIAGVLHLVVGRIFDFYNNLDHGLGEAIMESGSWILFTVGLWLWVFTRTAMGPKPAFMFEVFGSGDGAALPIGFTGFPVLELFRFTVPGVGFTMVVGVALAMTIVGLVMVIAAEGGIGLIESITQGFGHVVSYTRIAAVLLAKAGMALAVNLLVFGATLHGGEFHLIWFMSEEPVADDVVFQGLLNLDGSMAIVGLLFGIVLLVLGHLLVLVLGITSAGLQAVRLEYVEFFGKFFEGGGKAYEPFGYDREFTTED
ncbi:V-type ATP synthase subunit I [Halomicrobium sp. HM KBTZ05]|uniref:A-type ATP synthase subunit I n=1 Tax=Halomicrobium mukohataei TaxID=57705 RepID=A0A847TU87_9EURY|nr:V-type ATPase 116kDa subunit family protein [Halomicrobium mukohataei]NLV09602.1 V-type ATP synthase subunit I [Halomicrobium mukohataei]